MKAVNLFDGIPNDLPEELFVTLLQADGLTIKRIVSQGQSSPPGSWYDQDEAEWVIVLKGSAVIQCEGEAEPIELQPGSYLNIPAHKRHRVASTSLTGKTVWLAVHYRASGS
ncbi:MAG: cupin domain-containing protein [Thermoguttaceae bacterium]